MSSVMSWIVVVVFAMPVLLVLVYYSAKLAVLGYLNGRRQFHKRYYQEKIRNGK
jgi:hypothetical protein